MIKKPKFIGQFRLVFIRHFHSLYTLHLTPRLLKLRAMYALVLCIFLAANAQNPVQKNIAPQHRQNQSAAYAKSKSAPSTPAYTASDEPQTTNQSNQAQNESREQVQRIELVPQSDWWFKGYVIATLIIAAINLGMLIAIWQQRNAMRLQLKLMQASSQQQNDMIRLEHRARVNLNEIKFELKPNQRLPVRVYFKNTGRTPAKGLSAWVFIEYTAGDKAPRLLYDKDKPVLASPAMPPNLLLCIPLDGRVLDPNSIHNIGNRREKIFIMEK